MTMQITLGWWLIPLAISITAVWWLGSQNYRGDYNFAALFTFPMTAFVICLAWMVYFAIGWALA
jgi:hypothetical protein